MKETPILFNGPMVRAQQAGTKTQTRRLVKFPLKDPDFGCELAGNEIGQSAAHRLCPYGKPGDRLWVREAVQLTTEGCEPGVIALRYPADGEIVFPDAWPEKCDGLVKWINGKWSRPSILMPRWASRTTLEIACVHVARLNSISNRDARLEGVCGVDWGNGGDYGGDANYLTPYRDLWESIHGAGSWAANPWVWVVDFLENQSHG